MVVATAGAVDLLTYFLTAAVVVGVLVAITGGRTCSPRDWLFITLPLVAGGVFGGVLWGSVGSGLAFGVVFAAGFVCGQICGRAVHRITRRTTEDRR